MTDAVALARLFHDTYERLAPAFGYETRQDTKVFDETSANGRLMTAVAGEVLRDLESRLAEANATTREVMAQRDAARKDHIEIAELLGCTELDDDYIGALRVMRATIAEEVWLELTRRFSLGGGSASRAVIADVIRANLTADADVLRQCRDICDVGTNADLLLEVRRLNETDDAWIERAAKDAACRSNCGITWHPQFGEPCKVAAVRAREPIATAIRDAMREVK